MNLDNGNNALVRLLKENGLIERVHLLGIRKDILTVMNGIDLFMLSSISEAFPNVLNEAMACGTPCITTDVGDSGLIVIKTGWVVEPKDPKALANAHQALKEKQLNNESWGQRKDACRQRIIENFTFEKMIKKYKSLGC